jgi:hypothetical protein
MNFNFAVAVGAAVVARSGRAELAAVFAGVADGADYTWSGEEQADFEHTQQEARTALGDAAYDAARQRGATMAYEEVVAVVLGELDRVIAELEDA